MAEIAEELLDELERMERDAPPAPWVALVMGGVSVGELDENTRGFARGGVGTLFEIEPDASYYINLSEEVGEDEDEGDADAARQDERFITALRNAAPQLIAAARESAKLAERVEWLESLWYPIDRISRSWESEPYKGWLPDTEREELRSLLKASHDARMASPSPATSALVARAEAAEARVREQDLLIDAMRGEILRLEEVAVLLRTKS